VGYKFTEGWLAKRLKFWCIAVKVDKFTKVKKFKKTYCIQKMGNCQKKVGKFTVSLFQISKTLLILFLTWTCSLSMSWTCSLSTHCTWCPPCTPGGTATEIPEQNKIFLKSA
jgi:hypothetical protein